MEVEDMIRIYDGFIHPETISRLIKYAIKDAANMKYLLQKWENL